ncbi:MAG TPA: hypothetical protein PLS70_21525 [Acidobacteriota bacterium]|nr:hypothetical protein [Acidobacteriota bacterium]
MIEQFVLLFALVAFVSLFTWVPLNLVCALIAQRKPALNYPKLVKHLKTGPTIACTTFFLAIFGYHFGMIGVCHSRMLAYIYLSPTNERPEELRLHLVMRIPCGNAAEGLIYSTYGSTAVVGVESSDPSVRARSLRMFLNVYPWSNVCGLEGESKEMIDRLKLDPAPEVQAVIEENRELIERTCVHEECQ